MLFLVTNLAVWKSGTFCYFGFSIDCANKTLWALWFLDDPSVVYLLGFKF